MFADCFSKKKNKAAAIDATMIPVNNFFAHWIAKTYRILLRYLVDLGLVNLPTSFDTKLIFNLEQKSSKLFESKAK